MKESFLNKVESIKYLDLFDRAEYNSLWFLDHMVGEKNVDKLFAKKREALKNRIVEKVSKNEGKGRTIELERIKITDITPKEFRQTYLKYGIPVIFDQGAKDWECVQKWKPEFLADKYGEDKISLIDASPDDYHNISYETRETTLREIIMSMDEGNIDLKKYSRFNKILHEHPELKNDFDMKWLLSMRNAICSGQTFQVFIGGRGTKTHIHCAVEHNLFTQVYGRKHWYIYPPEYDCLLYPSITRTPYFHTPFDPDAPDYDLYPGMKYVDTYECTLEAGDIMFLPPSYWHHVKNLTGSIGVAFRWFSADAFKVDLMQGILTMLSTNPPFILAAKDRTDFAKIFSYMSKKQKRDRERV